MDTDFELHVFLHQRMPGGAGVEEQAFGGKSRHLFKGLAGLLQNDRYAAIAEMYGFAGLQVGDEAQAQVVVDGNGDARELCTVAVKQDGKFERIQEKVFVRLDAQIVAVGFKGRAVVDGEDIESFDIGQAHAATDRLPAQMGPDAHFEIRSAEGHRHGST